MNYPTYLIAARRHLKTCKILIEKIENFDELGQEYEKKMLIQNTYYLLGYVIECSLKFKILEISGYSKTTLIDKNGCKDVDLNFTKDIMIHDLDRLQNTLSSKIPDLTYIAECTVLNTVMSKWSPEIRYIDSDTNQEIIKSFYSQSEKFLKLM